MTKKKYILLGIGLVIVSLSVIGFSYAYWMLSMNQSDQNVVYSDCFEMSFTGENAINLQNAYPMTKDELETDFFPKAKPYHFTITNICSNVAHASINLESLPIEEKINDEYIDVILYKGEDDINDDPKILSNESYKLTSNKENQSKVIQEAEKAYQLTNISLNGKEKKEYNLLLFLDEETPPMKNSQWKGKITINSAYEYQYSEDILNGAIPDLSDGKLIPVQISETELPSNIEYSNEENQYGGKVTKADVTKEWYSYENKKWANAVILRAGKEDIYKPGEEIKEEDIESYFVWIPRYKYRLKDNEETLNTYKSVTNIGNVGSVDEFYSKEQVGGNKGANTAFEIEFENVTEPPSNGTKINEWLTHPAFTSFNSNGFWVGKFETGYNQSSDTSKEITTTDWNVGKAQVNNEEPEKVIIKPNVYSWRSIQVANAFYTSYNYKRELESHMMKNSEWGAVAYLTQSIYGRCEANGSCTEMNQNNSEYYITGMSTIQAPTCGYTASKETCNWYGGPKDLNVLDSGEIKSYYLTASKNGSTTGNYSGIYDMSGGAWEYVMGVMQSGEQDKNPASGRNNTYNSGINGKFTCPTCDGLNGSSLTELNNGKSWPLSMYYDLYDYNVSDQEYQRGHLGDATKEFGPFYSVGWPKTGGTSNARKVGGYNADLADFVFSYSPWFLRGGAHTDGTDAGVSAFSYATGSADIICGFRIILTP